ncbi:uncharacterized protein LOC123269935 [Cotesia glomerata]|uniref:Uncharacterized protein n=1 Tax=Cotesia glomerata TaxID=32391 RepID=A0AAV7I960_COTGL|nr:uncharacterized protein LOC123269935 [Cotesia glomerata]XP_044591818.1 uncharacterized protein LOC123269935 [Cotesia glomerata]KAH0547250.1 hypothetical protein KQX54_018064 [Cotesia glomerata]
MITWVMVGLLLAAETHGRNFLSDADDTNDQILVKLNGVKRTAGTNGEDTYRLTCYTCVNVSDNQMCNTWAIDTPCPPDGKDFCRSLHILDSRGNSVLVSKSCASSAECGPASVGCVPIDTQKICISCCDVSYCNVDSPTNSSNAIYSRKRRKSKKRKKVEKNSSSRVSARRLIKLLGFSIIATLFYAYHCYR